MVAPFPAPNPLDPATGGAPILVVDDDPGVREVIRWALEEAGLAVTTAADGRQALEHAARHPPKLVVLDLMLPLLDGAAVATALRVAHGATLPILAVTADGRAGEKARRVGAYHYLTKPFDVDELVAAVRRGLGAS